MMAVLFLVLAAVAVVVVGDAAVTNPSAGSLSVFNHAITGFTEGQLVAFAAGLGLLVALCAALARGWSRGHRAKRRARRAVRRDLEGKVAELERENARQRKELGRLGGLADLRAASSEPATARQPQVHARA